MHALLMQHKKRYFSFDNDHLTLRIAPMHTVLWNKKQTTHTSHCTNACSAEARPRRASTADTAYCALKQERNFSSSIFSQWLLCWNNTEKVSIVESCHLTQRIPLRHIRLWNDVRPQPTFHFNISLSNFNNAYCHSTLLHPSHLTHAYCAPDQQQTLRT